MPNEYYLGNWVWENQEWTHPGRAAIDLRPLWKQSSKGGTEGLCLFVSDKKNNDPHWEHVGTGDLNTKVQSRVVRRLRVGRARPKGNTLGELLLDLLTNHADPTGEGEEPPLLSPRESQLNIHLGSKYSRIYSPQLAEYNKRLLTGLQHKHKKLVKLAEKSGKDFDQKFLYVKSRQFKIPWREIADKSSHHRKPVRPTTDLSDDFNRADGPLGPNWLDYKGSWTIVVNRARPDGTTDLQLARYQTPLSIDDHYSEIDWETGTSSGAFAMAACRIDSDGVTQNYYAGGGVASTDRNRIYKVLGGSLTLLYSENEAHSLPESYRLECTGSDIELFKNGISVASVSDGAISGNPYVGMMARKSAQIDNWGSSDGVEVVSSPEHIRQIRVDSGIRQSHQRITRGIRYQ